MPSVKQATCNNEAVTAVVEYARHKIDDARAIRAEIERRIQIGRTATGVSIS